MVTRRFIAGAVCPACGAMDKLVMLMESSDKRRECVSCGYNDGLDKAPAPDEPPTRVNQVRPGAPTLAHEDEVQTLTLSDGKPARSD